MTAVLVRCTLLAVLLTVNAAPSFACSCVGPFPEEWMTQASLVFRGRVTRTRRLDSRVELGGRPHSHAGLEVTFRVLERFKGPAVATYVVVYGECVAEEGSGAECIDMCSQATDLRGEWVVFAYPGRVQSPATDDCSAFAVDSDARAAFSLRQLRARR